MAVSQNDFQDLKGEVKDLRTEVGVLRGEVNELRNEVGVLRSEVKELRAEVGLLRDEVNELSAEVKDLKTEMRDNTEELKRHFDISFERMSSIVQLLAEGLRSERGSRKSVEDRVERLEEAEINTRNRLALLERKET